MKLLASLISAALILCPSALADPTDNGIGNNPGLQQNCVFNAAFNRAHAQACKPYNLEVVASNNDKPRLRMPPR